MGQGDPGMADGGFTGCHYGFELLLMVAGTFPQTKKTVTNAVELVRLDALGHHTCSQRDGARCAFPVQRRRMPVMCLFKFAQAVTVTGAGRASAIRRPGNCNSASSRSAGSGFPPGRRSGD